MDSGELTLCTLPINTTLGATERENVGAINQLSDPDILGSQAMVRPQSVNETEFGTLEMLQ